MANLVYPPLSQFLKNLSVTPVEWTRQSNATSSGPNRNPSLFLGLILALDTFLCPEIACYTAVISE